jgi:hypothetical protein
MGEILNKCVPFDGMSAEKTAGLILNGERPAREKILEEHREWEILISICWKEHRFVGPLMKGMTKDTVKMSGGILLFEDEKK